MSEKSEEPTPKRLQKALEEGDSGASSAFAQAAAFVVAAALAPGAFTALGRAVTRALTETVSTMNVAPITSEVVIARLVMPVVTLAAPLLLAVGVTGAVFGAVQAGGVIATRRLAPDLSRLDPIRGLRGLFSRVRAFGVLRSIVGAAAVALLAYRDLHTHAHDLVRLAGRPQHVVPAASTMALTIAKWAVALGLALGAIDLIVTRQAWRKRLRMSKDEVKREHKESEGDPEIKAARHRVRQEMLAAANAAAVKGATVVIVNPTHLACALRFDEEAGDEAPVVLANGEGFVAQEMVKAAREYGVPVVQNVPLARALHALESDSEIPEALYEAVAEILQEIYAQTAER